MVEETWHPYKKNLFPQTSSNEVGGYAVVTVTTDPPAGFFENKEWKEHEFVTDEPLLREAAFFLIILYWLAPCFSSSA